MEGPDLRLIGARDRHEAASGSPLAAAGGLAILLFALLATLLGADGSRRPVDARDAAERALQVSLELGSDAPEVVDTLKQLRRILGVRPLDSKTRVAYAGLLLGLSSSIDETQAASFHACRAAELAPVTVPVVRSAAMILARTGDTDASLRIVKEMFGYDAPRAARLLTSLEILIPEDRRVEAIPESAVAWTAWVARLRHDGRVIEADAWLERTIKRWPDHVPSLTLAAAQSVIRGDWERLADLLPPTRVLDEDTESAALFLHRARLHATRNETGAARRDVTTGLQLGGAAPGNQILAGDVYDALGVADQARHHWNRALHGLSSDALSARRAVLLRLARLEDRRGRSAAALRLWRSLLEITPDDPEASRRMNELAGRP